MKKNDQAFFFFNLSHFLFFRFFFQFNIFFNSLVPKKIYRPHRRKKNLTRVLRGKQAIFFLWPHCHYQNYIPSSDPILSGFLVPLLPPFPGLLLGLLQDTYLSLQVHMMV